MRSIAVILCAALFGLNAEAAFLHVHAGGADGHHDHGPATHEHRVTVHAPPTQSTLAAPDEDTAVPVLLAKATPRHGHELMTAAIAVVALRDPGTSFVPLVTVAPRAHGPPDRRPCSLRAPPRDVLL
jgi:hypothetical protein